MPADWDDARPPARRARSKTVPDARWQEARAEAHAMMVGGDWSAAKPLHLVAAYALLHLQVYGVESAEMTPQARLFACGSAARMLDVEFGGDAGAMAAFLRWTWTRERAREKFRRDRGTGGGNIGVRLQFHGSLLTQYRIDVARRQK